MLDLYLDSSHYYFKNMWSIFETLPPSSLSSVHGLLLLTGYSTSQLGCLNHSSPGFLWSLTCPDMDRNCCFYKQLFYLFKKFTLTVSRDMWDLSSLTRDWTSDPCSGSMKSLLWIAKEVWHLLTRIWLSQNCAFFSSLISVTSSYGISFSLSHKRSTGLWNLFS